MLTPYMPQAEIAMMDMVFALKRPARVLEFGAGGSTVRWSGLPFIERWVTVEHDPEWMLKTEAEAPHATILYASELIAANYVNDIPQLCGAGPFDLIFVDGEHRVECIKASPQWLAPDGVVVLHDAIRLEYAEAWGVYPYRAMLTRGECVRGRLALEHDGCRNGLMVMWGGG